MYSHRSHWCVCVCRPLLVFTLWLVECTHFYLTGSIDLQGLLGVTMVFILPAGSHSVRACVGAVPGESLAQGAHGPFCA